MPGSPEAGAEVATPLPQRNAPNSPFSVHLAPGTSPRLAQALPHYAVPPFGPPPNEDDGQPVPAPGFPGAVLLFLSARLSLLPALRAWASRQMTILNFYADGAGHPDYAPPVERGDTVHYCIVGILVDDAQRQEIEAGGDAIISRFFPDREPRTVDLKASWISARRNQKLPWSELPGPQHAAVFDAIRDLALRVRPVLFGQIVDKAAYRESIHASRPERPATNALRFLVGRLDHHLLRGSHTARFTLDEDTPALQEAHKALESQVRAEGDKITGAGRPAYSVSRFERVLPFQHLSSDQSRCLQLADYVSHQLWQAAEHEKATRLRELDPLWASFGQKRDPGRPT